MIIRRIIIFIIFASFPIYVLFTSCRGKSGNGMLIITQVSDNIHDQNFITGELWRYVPGAQIVSINPAKPASSRVLTGEFYSACYPEISYDGEKMLFAAQPEKDDPWEIWEMELDNLKARKIISFKDNCTDPVYLPVGCVAFTRLIVNDTVRTAQCLYSCNPDGSDIRQITFSPHSNFATTVLKDGRLLTISRQLFPDLRDPVFMVLRPDGTKADMFYKGTEGSSLVSRGRETTDGKIVFIESATDSLTGGDVVTINYNRPLHTRVNLSSDIEGDFNSVLPMNSGRFLVSFRKPGSDNYALYEFDPDKKAFGQVIYENKEYNVLDVVPAVKYDRPKKLPSEVDLHVKTGLLLCQDINVLRFQSAGKNPGSAKASMIEVIGIDSTYGMVPVEDDGSFYLKVLADKPFQIRTLDKNNSVVHGPCSWLWLRPNERRGCVGCHEDPELVPENRIPAAVKKPPVIIPVHITAIKEKTVELE